MWPIDRRRLLSIGLPLIAVAVVSASVLAGFAALARDLRTAYLWAGPSIIREADRRQIDAVRKSLEDGEVIFVYADPEHHWHARLWQRALFPRNPVAVHLDASPEGPRSLRDRFAVRHAVVIGPPAFAPRLRAERDLGPLQGMRVRVSFGELP
jgi:hypothetical protein